MIVIIKEQRLGYRQPRGVSWENGHTPRCCTLEALSQGCGWADVMAVQEKCDEKKQVAFGLLCGEFHPSPSARRMGYRQCYLSELSPWWRLEVKIPALCLHRAQTQGRGTLEILNE